MLAYNFNFNGPTSHFFCVYLSLLPSLQCRPCESMVCSFFYSFVVFSLLLLLLLLLLEGMNQIERRPYIVTPTYGCSSKSVYQMQKHLKQNKAIKVHRTKIVIARTTTMKMPWMAATITNCQFVRAFIAIIFSWTRFSRVNFYSKNMYTVQLYSCKLSSDQYLDISGRQIDIVVQIKNMRLIYTFFEHIQFFFSVLDNWTLRHCEWFEN